MAASDDETPERFCACKGVNTCFHCEDKSSTPYEPFVTKDSGPSYVFCPLCNLAWPGWEGDSWRTHPDHEGTPLRYPGVHIALDWISREEEDSLMEHIDTMPWDASQSGRRKQNFGPKTNFKRRKLKLGKFTGFPEWGRFVQERCMSHPVLRDYQTIEQCSLEYRPSEGACILAHIDDCWVWGERVVTLSMTSDSVLTLVKYMGGTDKYNLAYRCPSQQSGEEVSVSSAVNDGTSSSETLKMDANGQAASHPMENGTIHQTNEARPNPIDWWELDQAPTVRLPMPRRSLLVLEGSPRYDWLHGVLREDITSRRVCIALREFTPAFLPGGEEEDVGKEVLAIAKRFWKPSPLEHSVEKSTIIVS